LKNDDQLNEPIVHFKIDNDVFTNSQEQEDTINDSGYVEGKETTSDKDGCFRWSISQKLKNFIIDVDEKGGDDDEKGGEVDEKGGEVDEKGGDDDEKGGEVDEKGGDDEGKETTSNKDGNFRWSIDISNLQTKDMKNSKREICVAVSRITDKDIKNMNDKKDEKDKRDTTAKTKKRNGTTIIYRIDINNHENKITYRIHKISGICRFVHEPKSDEVPNSESNNKCLILRRFVILSFDGIYSFHCKDDFKIYKKFDYPYCIERELETLNSQEISEYINLLLSCIYDKYFLVEHYKDNVQLLEGSD
jgi:hypothetical protein